MYNLYSIIPRYACAFTILDLVSKEKVVSQDFFFKECDPYWYKLCTSCFPADPLQ